MIENEEPGQGGIHLYSTVGYSTGDDVPALDVEELTDRLRFMGLDRDFVAEAERELREDPRRGMEWLERRLTELEPLREPPTCGCGEPLVDPDWRGRATIRCTVCGSRWGVEVVDEETESMWAISGPSEEWRASHPVVEEDFEDVDPAEVIRDGLPPLPNDGIDPGAYFPVASWRDGPHAAVLYVHRQEPGDWDLPGDEYEDEIEHLVLDSDGDWMSTGSGGGNWINVFDPPLDLLEKYVVLGTGTTGTVQDHVSVSFTGGLCSSRVAVIETSDRTGTKRYEIAPSRPFFVVGAFGRGQVRVLGADGQVLTGAKGRRLEFELGA